MALEHCLIVGLGNPGKEYVDTRHNLGYMVVQEFARQRQWLLQRENRFDAYATKGTIAGTTVHLLLPTTYMNCSGHSVRRIREYYKLMVDQIIVVVDDVALPFGTMRLRAEGSPGGHNGLKSIEQHLGTNRYMRLKMGISSKETEGMSLRGGQESLSDYVLARFSPEERQQLPSFIEQGVKVLMRLLSEPFPNVMSSVNAKIRC